MTSTPASTNSSWQRRVSPDPPAAFSALQTTRPKPQRGMSRGRTWQTILRPGAPTTSPINRIFRGMRTLIGSPTHSREGILLRPARPKVGRSRFGFGPARSSREFDSTRLAEHGHLDLPGIGQQPLDRAGDVAADLGRLRVVE